MKDKTITFIIVCLISISSAYSQQPEKIDIPTEWKFITGDCGDSSKPAYARPEYNDQDWKTIMTGSPWEKQGYPNYDGIAWYRVRLIIPSALKKNNSWLKALRISLGCIDDDDITFFNGEKIGSTVGWEIDRFYTIPFNLINWDKENVIAIRVNDTGGDGGMYAGIYMIGSAILSDLITIKDKDKDKPLPVTSLVSTKFSRTLLINCKIPTEKFNITVHVNIYDPFSKVILYQKEDNITVGNNAVSSYIFSAYLKLQVTSKIDYLITSKYITDTLKYSTLFSYLQGDHKKEHLEYPVIKPVKPYKSTPFALENIRLGGYLNERMDANLRQRLLNIDETGILEGYYNRPGKQSYVGEYAGKYLHAATRVWRSTHNAPLKAQMDRIVDILISCQNNDGYLGTYLPANYWTEWDVWSHKYNLLGLLSYYSATGFKPALEASKKMGDLICKTFGDNPGQLNIIEHGYHMGMASTSILEPMTDLYRFTGDKKYLDFCYYIIRAYDYKNGPHIISTLTTLGKVDKTGNGKAYEMMSNLTGIVKLYQLTGDEKLLKAAENAWKDISTYKLYITGTASQGEFFRDDFVLPAGNEVSMGEGCVSTTWLQFSQVLYYLKGESKYIDEIEKTIYNHLFAAENPQTGCVSYYTALQGKKHYRCTIDGHCCLASVPRGIAAIPELVFTKDAIDGFNVNLYTSCILHDSIISMAHTVIPIEFSIATKFPEAGTVEITVNPREQASFKVGLRVPVWCQNYMAKINGETLTGTPGQYLNIERSWEKHTKIQVSFDLNNQLLDGGKSYPGYVAVKVGTQVLAFDQALNPEIKELDKLALSSSNISLSSTTILPAGWVGCQPYISTGYYDGKPVKLTLVPFADAGQTGGEVRVWIKKQ